jgi:hypothetical protein
MRILAAETSIENRRLAEINRMEAEEIYTKDINSRVIEIRSMEHEDIMSIMREKYDDEIQQFKEKRMKYLADVYEPFEPYKFKKESIRLPELHSLFSDPNLNDNQYEPYDNDYYDQDKSSSLLYLDEFISQYDDSEQKPEYHHHHDMGLFSPIFETMESDFKPIKAKNNYRERT